MASFAIILSTVSVADVMLLGNKLCSESNNTNLLTLSPPIPLRLYILPYWSNPLFLIFDIRALWHSVLSAREPEYQKIKNGGLDQYGAEPFEQQQYGTAEVEAVNMPAH